MKLSRNVFSEARFLYLDERKKQTRKTNNLKEDSHEKNCSETKRTMAQTERFRVKVLMCICARENSSN